MPPSQGDAARRFDGDIDALNGTERTAATA
jgi:hypothetical protein